MLDLNAMVEGTNLKLNESSIPGNDSVEVSGPYEELKHFIEKLDVNGFICDNDFLNNRPSVYTSVLVCNFNPEPGYLLINKPINEMSEEERNAEADICMTGAMTLLFSK